MTRKIKLVIFILLLIASHSFAQVSNESAVKNVEQVLEKLSEYNYGEPQLWKPELIEAMKPVYSNPDVQKEVEQKMLDFLQSDATVEAKKAIQKEFAIIATKDSEEGIIKLLQNEETVNLALAVMDHARLGSVEQYKKIVPYVSVPAKIGIINLLGNRQEEEATEFLNALAQKEDEQVKMAVLSALANIASTESIESLMKLSKTLPASFVLEVNGEKLSAAYGLWENGHEKEAQNIFEDLTEADQLSIQAAALNGLFEMSGDKAEFIKKQLEKYDEPDLRSEVIRLVIKLPENYKKGSEFFEGDLSVPEKIQLLSILGDRKDNSVHDMVINYLKGENENLRLTALKVIPETGSANDVILLAETAAESGGSEKQLAQNALYTIPGKEVNQKIINLLSSASPEVKVELIQAAGERNMTEAASELFKLAESENSKVKNEAVEALGKVAGFSALEKLTGLLLKAGSPRERKALEDAVYLVAARNPEASESSAVLVNILKKTDTPKNISSLLAILGQIGNPEDYNVIREYFSHSDEEVQSSAIRAVAQWPTAQPLDELLEFLKDESDVRQHALAMKSYLQIVESNGKMSSEEKVEKLNTAYDLSENLVEKRMIISGYSKISEPGSLEKLAGLMDVPETRREVEMAILEMAPEIWEQDELVIAQLEKVMVLSDNESFIKRVAEEIKKRSE